MANSATQVPSDRGHNVATLPARAPSRSLTLAAANRHEQSALPPLRSLRNSGSDRNPRRRAEGSNRMTHPPTAAVPGRAAWTRKAIRAAVSRLRIRYA